MSLTTIHRKYNFLAAAVNPDYEKKKYIIIYVDVFIKILSKNSFYYRGNFGNFKI
ncbi:hypothetical protein rpr22_CDSx132 [Rickettsia prowazekii str. Rp22]|uniref:Uncharacterized protein n=1 Tax=Rickettsia prowazekii (strain Rp22) TaxID=449216 RepID=D5AW49_RICPP|nr:hypothetical protein rpr22_CDSx132 [Rickettsia prowazekii str. Rp22]